MNTFCVRFYRRCIIKNFGSCRNLLIWATSVFVTVLLLDHFVFYSETHTGTKYDLQANLDVADRRNTSCGQVEVCKEGQSSYMIVSGYEIESQPLICFNGERIFSPEKKNGKRGFNLVNINGKTRKVEDVRTFDTYEDDTVFQRYLRLGIENSNILLLTTADEASLHLSDDSKKLIASFGGSLIDQLDFRSSYSMIGQRNLKAPAKGVEQLMKRTGDNTFASPAIIKGCVSIPLGAVSEEAVTKEAGKAAAITDDKVKVGDFSPNCGMPESCKEGHYPIRIMGENLNNAGRGIMVGVVDVDGGAVLKIERFDTYESKTDSEKLVELLKSISDTHMIFALAHDEAFTALSDEAKRKLASFGSSFIADLDFRGVWVFVGKPELAGFTPYEDVELTGKSPWPFPIDAKFCIDKKFVGRASKLEVSLKKNMLRRAFCKAWDGYDEFCSVSEIDKHPAPLPQKDASMKDHPIYEVPVVVVPGMSHVSLMKQLSSLMDNPGIKLDMINMMYDEKFEESAEVAKLFKVKVTKLPSSAKYINLVHAALSEVWNQYPQAKHVILLEEEVIPMADLLYFLGQCLEVVEADETLAGVSAFNENGFVGLSADESMLYRGETFPGFGMLLKKDFYESQMKGNINTCCSKRSWFGWTLPSNHELLFPDVSRVSRRRYLGLTEHSSFLRQYLNAERVNTSSNPSTTPSKLSGLEHLSSLAYSKLTNRLLSTATLLSHADLLNCIKGKEKLTLTSDTTYVIYYKASLTTPEASVAMREGGGHLEADKLLVKVAPCFGLEYVPYTHLRGVHEGTLRFQYKGSQVLLVSDASPFYKNKLLNQDPFALSLLD